MKQIIVSKVKSIWVSLSEDQIWFFATTIAIHLCLWILIGVGFFLFDGISVGGMKIKYSTLWLIFYVGYMISPLSWTKINPNEVGVKLFFGKPLYVAKEGPTYIALPFINVVRLPTTTVSFDVPATGEMVRVTFKSDAGSAGQTITDPAMRSVTCEPKLTATFVIDDPKNFLRVTPGVEAAKAQLADYIVSVLQELVAKKTAREVLDKLGDFNRDLTQGVMSLIDIPQVSPGQPAPVTQAFDWGVRVQVVLKDIGLPHKVNTELAEMAAAVAQPEKAKHLGEAKRVDAVKVAEAKRDAAALDVAAADFERQAAKTRGEGEGARLHAIANTTGVEPSAVLAQETAVKIVGALPKTLTTLAVGGDSGAMGAAGAIASALKGGSPNGGNV